MVMTDEHRKILQSLMVEPLTVHGGSVGGPLLQLVAAGLVRETTIDQDEALYEVTHAGREVGNG